MAVHLHGYGDQRFTRHFLNSRSLCYGCDDLVEGSSDARLARAGVQVVGKLASLVGWSIRTGVWDCPADLWCRCDSCGPGGAHRCGLGSELVGGRRLRGSSTGRPGSSYEVRRILDKFVVPWFGLGRNRPRYLSTRFRRSVCGLIGQVFGEVGGEVALQPGLPGRDPGATHRAVVVSVPPPNQEALRSDRPWFSRSRRQMLPGRLCLGRLQPSAWLENSANPSPGHRREGDASLHRLRRYR